MARLMTSRRVNSGFFLHIAKTALYRAFELVRIEARRYGVNVVGSEVVGLVPIAFADHALDFMLNEMRQPPSWAPDLPLDAEGGWDTCYSK